jgi:DNA-binding Lrp family transcriptional regulator
MVSNTVSATYRSVLDADDMNDTDWRIVEELRDGRVTPTYLADRVGISREYASDRLKRMVEHDMVERPAAGLYELVEAPERDDG